MARLALVGLRLLRRDPAAALLTLRMAGWVAFVSAVTLCAPLPAALRLVRPRRARAAKVEAEDIGPALAARLDVLLRSNWLFLTPTCWKRAAVLHRYLALGGVETRIVFGVRASAVAPLLDAHAWLEANGRPVLENVPAGFQPIYSFPR